MKVLLTGATGFVGSYILKELLNTGHNVRALVRPGSGKHLLQGPDVEKVEGDILNPESLKAATEGCDAVIHLVGIIEEKRSKGITYMRISYEGSRNVADAARNSGVARFILMSANGAREKGVSEYQTSKWMAEQYVKSLDFAHWVIIRPSIIFGKPAEGQPEFVTQLCRQLIRPFPVIPVFGNGLYRMQPISVEEVAKVFVQSLNNESANGKTYCTAGQKSHTFLEILDIIAGADGRKPKPKIKQPIWLARPLVNTVGRIGLIPITPDQFNMLIEGNSCDSSELYQDFDIEYKPFTPENLDYVQRT